MLISLSFVWVGNDEEVITGSSVVGLVSALLVVWSVAGKSWSDSCVAICLTSIGLGVFTIAWLRSGGTGVSV